MLRVGKSFDFLDLETAEPFKYFLFRRVLTIRCCYRISRDLSEFSIQPLHTIKSYWKTDFYKALHTISQGKMLYSLYDLKITDLKRITVLPMYRFRRKFQSIIKHITLLLLIIPWQSFSLIWHSMVIIIFFFFFIGTQLEWFFLSSIVRSRSVAGLLRRRSLVTVTSHVRYYKCYDLQILSIFI